MIWNYLIKIFFFEFNLIKTKIIQNAMALGINVDAKTPEGKKNLAELDEYSGRFNADADENHFRYK